MENPGAGSLGFIGIVNEANVFDKSTLSNMKVSFREPFSAVQMRHQLCKTPGGYVTHLEG